MQPRLAPLTGEKAHSRRMVVGFGVLVALLLLQAPVMAQIRDSGKTPIVGRSAAIPGKTTILGLRVGVHGSKTRIVMDMDGPVKFSSFALADPYRVVLDLSEVDFTLAVPRLTQKTGGVSGYRFGLFEPGMSRVVIDLAEPRIIASTFELPPSNNRGHRLVIDLQKVSRPVFLATSAQSVSARIQERRRARPPDRIKPRSIGASNPQTPNLGAPTRKKKKRVIVLDPGHGGVDPGAIGISGIYEKTVVLAAALTLKRVLETTGRYSVVLTRKNDRFLRLRERVAASRAVDADLFISLHADSITDSRLRGASIYTLSEQSSDKEAARLAEQENKSDIIAGMNFSDKTPEVTNILIDLAQRETMNQSARFAGFLTQELRSAVRTHRRAHRFAGFAVLKAPDVPSVLLEIGYLSNREEERMLRSRAFQERIAVAVRRGIDHYFAAVQSATR
jgi:N-acetylmuramoyl-L-alanine amidase